MKLIKASILFFLLCTLCSCITISSYPNSDDVYYSSNDRKSYISETHDSIVVEQKVYEADVQTQTYIYNIWEPTYYNPYCHGGFYWHSVYGSVNYWYGSNYNYGYNYWPYYYGYSYWNYGYGYNNDWNGWGNCYWHHNNYGHHSEWNNQYYWHRNNFSRGNEGLHAGNHISPSATPKPSTWGHNSVQSNPRPVHTEVQPSQPKGNATNTPKTHYQASNYEPAIVHSTPRPNIYSQPQHSVPKHNYSAPKPVIQSVPRNGSFSAPKSAAVSGGFRKR